jgi:uncharacterized protein YuzE
MNLGDSAAAYPVRLTFDPEADAAYIQLADSEPGEAVDQVIVEGIPSPAEVVLDFNSDGQLLGVEVIGARAVLSPNLLAVADLPPPRHDEFGGSCGTE